MSVDTPIEIPRSLTDDATVVPAAPDEVARSVRKSLARRLLTHRSGLVGVIGLLLMAGVAMIGPNLVPYDPIAVNFADKLAQPSAEHPFGTDYLGRDVLSRTVDAAHRSLGTSVIIVIGVMVVGLGFGTLAGMAGRGIDALIMRIVDVTLALPSLVLALSLVGILGASLETLILALILAQSPWYIRLFRIMVLRERERPYVLVARVHGAGPFATARRHVLPALVGQLAVLASLDLGSVLLAVAGLSFLGMGVQPPAAEWGAMLSEGRNTFITHPHPMLVPGLFIFFTALMANLVGDALRDLLDPGNRGQD